jgi:uncharacterized protein (DUF362 family)
MDAGNAAFTIDPTVMVGVVAALAVGVSAWLGRRSATNDQSVTVNVNGLLDRIASLEAKVIDLERTVTVVRNQEAAYLARLLSAERRIRTLEDFLRRNGFDPRLIEDRTVNLSADMFHIDHNKED